METTEEIWRPIPGYEDRYCVSSHGRVMSHRRNGDLHLKPSIADATPRLNLYDRERRPRTMPLAQAVLLAFVGPMPPAHRIAYLDTNRDNCRLDNLAYVPISAVDAGSRDAGALARLRSGLDADQARAIAESPDKAVDISRHYGIPRHTVERIRQGRLWAAETADVRRSSYQRRPDTTVLTEPDVASILVSPERNRDLAERYGVSPSAISSIRRGETWRHVPRPSAQTSSDSIGVTRPAGASSTSSTDTATE